MRPPIARCSSSHHLVFDFFAPRLYNAHTPNRASPVLSRPYNLRGSCRRSSIISTATVANTTRPSILDVPSTLGNEPSQNAARMRNCALVNDVLGVWEAYGLLRDHNPRLLLGPQHYGSTSLMLVKLFSSVDSAEGRSDQEMHAMEELAFACAGAGYVEGLGQMMLWHLAKKDPTKVIDMYTRFENTVLVLDESGLERGSKQLDIDTDKMHSEYDTYMETRIENPDISRFNVTNIMAITMAAYARIKKRWRDALQLMLRQKQHRVTGDNLKVLEQELLALGISEEDVSRIVPKAEVYVEAGSMARLVQKPEVFKAHLRNLMKERYPLKRLDKVRRGLKRGFTSDLMWAATDESQVSPERPILVSEKIWAYLIYAYVRSSLEVEAELLWADVIRFGRTPGADMWNALLEGYRDTRQKDKLFRTWGAMKGEGIPRDARSYGAILGCLCRERGHSLTALKLFEEFKNTKASDKDSLFVYNTVLNGLLTANDTKTAFALYGEMKANGPRPDIVSYNTLILYYARKANLKVIADIVQRLTNAGVEPDVFTFTTILSAMLRARLPNGAQRLLVLMEKMGVKQNIATYSALVHSQVRRGTREGIVTAWQLLQQMERMKDVQPNIVTYTSFLAGVHRSRELSKELIASISSDIVETMRKRGMKPKLGTYHILFKACLENPDPGALHFFIDYFNMMRRSEIACHHDTWYIILDGLVRRKAWVLASELKNQMLDSGFQPMWGVLEKMWEIQGWEANPHRFASSDYEEEED